MKIQVQIRSVYGTDRIYPIDDTAKQFCKLTGTKTLTANHLNCIKSMGVTVTVVASDYGCNKTLKRIEK